MIQGITMSIKQSILWINELCGVKPQNEVLFRRALTHDSITKKAGGKEQRSNERLEFLGDRVLGLAIAHHLVNLYPGEEEGELARRLAWLASKEVLSEVALNIRLDKHILMSYAEEKSGGRKNSAILADTLEALLAFLYVEYGLDLCATFVKTYWNDYFNKKDPPKDDKSALQEWAQKKGYALPEYKILSQVGPDHDPKFVVVVKVGKLQAKAEAKSKKKAERKAARLLLEKVNK